MELETLEDGVLVLLALGRGNVFPAHVVVEEVLKQDVAHEGERDDEHQHDADEHVQAEAPGEGEGCVEGQQAVDVVAGDLGEGAVEAAVGEPYGEAGEAEEHEGADVEEVLGGGDHLQALVGEAALDEADAAAHEAEHADDGHEVENPVQEAEEGVLVAGGEADDGHQEEEDGAAHEHVEAEVEGIGADPQGLVVLERGLEEEDFHDEGLEIAQMINVALLFPPFKFFEVAAAVLGALAFMRNRVEFPADVERGGLHVFHDFYERRNGKAEHAEIPQEVNQCSHACSPIQVCLHLDCPRRIRCPRVRQVNACPASVKSEPKTHLGVPAPRLPPDGPARVRAVTRGEPRVRFHECIGE